MLAVNRFRHDTALTSSTIGLACLSNLAPCRLETVLQPSRSSLANIWCKVLDAIDQAADMRPHGRHLFRVQQDIHIIDNGRNLKRSNSWQNIIVWISLVIVRDQLTVNLLLEPRLRHLVHNAVGVWNGGTDSGWHITEGLHVLSFVVPSVPLMRPAIGAHLEDKCYLIIWHLFTLVNDPNKIWFYFYFLFIVQAMIIIDNFDTIEIFKH